MSDVFVSYASEDRDKAIAIANALERQGWSVWWDRANIPTGRRFDETIDDALRSANCILVLWSHKSIAKDWVLEEAAEGRDRGILIPVLIDEVQPPRGFRRYQAADLTDWDGRIHSREFKKLVADIRRFVGPDEKKPTEGPPVSPQESSIPLFLGLLAVIGVIIFLFLRDNGLLDREIDMANVTTISGKLLYNHKPLSEFTDALPVDMGYLKQHPDNPSSWSGNPLLPDNWSYDNTTGRYTYLFPDMSPGRYSISAFVDSEEPYTGSNTEAFGGDFCSNCFFAGLDRQPFDVKPDRKEAFHDINLIYIIHVIRPIDSHDDLELETVYSPGKILFEWSEVPEANYYVVRIARTDRSFRDPDNGSDQVIREFRATERYFEDEFDRTYENEGYALTVNAYNDQHERIGLYLSGTSRWHFFRVWQAYYRHRDEER